MNTGDCIFIPADNSIEDTIVLRNDEYKTQYGNRPVAVRLQELKAEGKITEVIPFDDAYNRMELSHITPFEKIDEDQYNFLLEVLPPMRWSMGNPGVFAMSEREMGNVTKFVFNWGDDYYTKCDTLKKTNNELLDELNNFRKEG